MTLVETSTKLPVIIVGAGPCGLIAAYAFQQYGIPFVIIERASRAKVCSNAGSGFELTPTAIEIMQNRMGIDVSKFLSEYEGMGMYSVKDATKFRHFLIPGYEGGAVNRAEMQNHMLEVLFPSPKDEEGILFCGSGLDSFQEERGEEGGHAKVVAKLTSGEEIIGCVLLACDGIHSRCRAIMHGGYDSTKDWETNSKIMEEKDPMHFCNTLCYWGKTPVPKGTDLEREFNKTQRADGRSDPCTTVMTLHPSWGVPVGIFLMPSKNGTMINWAACIRSEAPKVRDGPTDLTRRGGSMLTEAEKEKLFNVSSTKDNESIFRGVRSYPLLEKLFEMTPAKDITEAGLFDRENLDLPYSSEKKLAAILGGKLYPILHCSHYRRFLLKINFVNHSTETTDAAHPQTPFCGQGVNMAITDAYIYATSIAVALKNNKKSIQEAIAGCDTDKRRDEAKGIVKSARLYCNLFVSTNPVVTTLVWLYGKFASSTELTSQIVIMDASNKDYLEYLDGKICSPKEQEELREKS